jgi:replicative DNA helicase
MSSSLQAIPNNATNSSSSVGRVPPQNLEAEQSVIGSILLDPESIHTVLPLIRTDDFYQAAHQEIYYAMVQLAEQSRPIDLLTVTDQLTKNGKLELVGGAGYLSSLADNVHTSVNVQNYAGIVREKSTLREVISKSTKIIQEAFDEGDQVDEFLDRIEHVIFEISEKRSGNSLIPLSEVVKEGFKTIERYYDSPDAMGGTPTGFHELDKLLSGLQPSDLLIIAARPSMGKTAFALNIAQNVAIRSKVPVAIFSLEMSRAQLAMRMLCSEGRVDSAKLRGGGLTDEDWIRLTRAAGELSEAPVYIDDTAQVSALEMRAKCRRLKASRGLGLVIVDYMQLMRGHGRIESREREISEISRSLKAMAKELNVPVIALSQLNRAVESRDNKRPMMVDLRESGAIEQDADVITFIYRDEVYNAESPELGVAEIIIGKHRNGPTGTAKLAFLNKYTRFENLEYRYNESTPAPNE